MRRGADLSRSFTEAALDVVRRRTGLVFPESRMAAFKGGLAKSMARAGLGERMDEYLHGLEHDEALLDDLVGEITVGETYFFREPQQFALIRDTVLPSLMRDRAKNRPLRMWSAGCATGEEPYSLAIAVRELGLSRDVRIIATDISRVALARARRGLYGRWSLRGEQAPAITEYFEVTGSHFQLDQSVRDMVDFRYLNLAEDSYPSLAMGIWGLDLIICRNVLIYFDAETVARVAGRLLGSLGDDGWLLVGASDPVISDFAPCDVIVTDCGLAYRRRDRVPRKAAVPREVRVPASPPVLPAAPPDTDIADRIRAPSAVPTPAPSPRQAPIEPRSGSDAVRAYDERDYLRAEELARRDLAESGENAACWALLVRALANRGDLPAAGQACASALDRHRTSAELTYLHAVLLAEAGRYRDAAEAARRALYLDRGLIVAHVLLGGSRIRLGEVSGARRALLNAERLLKQMSPDEIVPASDGEPARRLAEMVRVQMRLIREPAA